VYLWTYKRHRIETYGVAKPAALPVVDQVDQELEDDDKCCPECGRELVDIAYGEKRSGFYSWTHVSPRV
jgi:transposase